MINYGELQGTSKKTNRLSNREERSLVFDDRVQSCLSPYLLGALTANLSCKLIHRSYIPGGAMETKQLKEELQSVKKLDQAIAVRAMIIILAETLAKVETLEERVEALTRGSEIENGWG